MTDELKPVRCGCGGEGKVIAFVSPYTETNRRFIRCQSCGMSTAEYLTEAEAIKAWNRAMSGNVIVYGNPDAPKSKTVG